jgi:hypothetical protein
MWVCAYVMYVCAAHLLGYQVLCNGNVSVARRRVQTSPAFHVDCRHLRLAVGEELGHLKVSIVTRFLQSGVVLVQVKFGAEQKQNYVAMALARCPYERVPANKVGARLNKELDHFEAPVARCSKQCFSRTLLHKMGLQKLHIAARRCD